MHRSTHQSTVNDNMKLATVLLLYVLSYSASVVTCLELRMTPKYLQAEQKSGVTVKCSTNQSIPLASCQFRIWYNGRKEAGDVIDITRSKDPALIKNLPMPHTIFTAVSSGTDFTTGDCGVTLTGVVGTQLLVGCKLTTEAEDSALKVIPLFFSDKDALKLIDNSEDKHVKLGENVTFGLKTKDKTKMLDKCFVKENGVTLFTVDDKPGTNQTTAGRYQAWLRNGECGVTISDLVGKGALYLVAEADGLKSTGAKVVTLILQQDLEMELDKRVEDAKVGDLLKATCTARVVPDQDLVWSWRLGTQDYGDDKTVHASNATWRWPWETAVITDSMNFTLTENDRHKNITCKLGKFNEDNTDLSTSKTFNFKLPTSSSTEPPPTETTRTTTSLVTSAQKHNLPESTTAVSSKTSTTQKMAPTIMAGTTVIKDDFDAESNALQPQTRDIPRTEEKASSTGGEQKEWKLNVSPAEFVTISRLETKTVMCRADPGTRLTDCEFSMDTADQPVYFNASLDSVALEAKFGTLTVKYHGLGLDRGECGIELTAPDSYKEKTFLLGCRARTENSGWKYNYIYVVDTSWLHKNIQLRTKPSSTYLPPGSNLTMQCDYYLPTKLQKCSFTLPGQKKVDIAKNHVPKAPDFYQYVGDGLDKGQCGIFIPDVSTLDTSKMNKLTCEIMIGRNIFSTREIQIVTVVRPCGGPELSITTIDFTPSLSLTFKCTAPVSRPPASLSWYLGVDPVSTAKVTEVPVDKWRWWRDLEGTTQTLTLKLTEADEGKEVTCVMRHMALKKTRRSSLTVNLPRGQPGTTRSRPDQSLYPSITFAVAVTVILVVAIVADLCY